MISSVPFLILGCLVLLLYSIQMVRYGMAVFKVLRVKSQPQTFDPQLVSLVVPVRNEKLHLEQLISDILRQDYPEEMLEVWFVDDHSSDGSGDYLSQVSSTYPHLNYFSLGSSGLGKKAAIHAGCLKAQGQWIIQTDADCRLPSGFVTAHVRAAHPGGGMVAGPVMLQKEKNIWNQVESLDYLSLTASSLASFVLKRPVMCSGASLSYSRNFYLEIANDLLKVPSPSGDDIFLMIQAVKRSRPVNYILDRTATVTASSSGNPGAFFQQRIRWGSKTRYTAYGPLVYLSSIVWLVNLLLFIMLIWSLLETTLMPWFLSVLAVKMLADLTVLLPSSAFFNRRSLIWMFFPVSFIYYIYISMAGLFSIFNRYHWKGRSHNAHKIRKPKEV